MITLEMIPRGKNNAITREQLCLMTGISDRQVRKEIRDLIDNGAVIMSSSGTKGYYLPESYEELDDYIDELTKRAKSCFMRLKSAKKLRNDRSQLFMGVNRNG